MSERKLNRVGSDHPRCCKASRGHSQCDYEACEGADVCFLHGGAQAQAIKQKQSLRNYQLQGEFAKQAANIAANGCHKDLTEEVILMRMMIANIVQNATDSNTFLLYSDKLEKGIGRVESLVKTIQNLQKQNGDLMDRETVDKIFDGIFNVIVKYIDDPDTIMKIGQECQDVIAEGTSRSV